MSVTVRATWNFDKNLDQIKEFFGEEGSAAFEAALDHLFGVVVPNLENFPEMGYDFLSRKSATYEALAMIDVIQTRLGDARLRELISGEYLILYTHRGDEVLLLTIRHHRQLSFDLRAHWLS